MIVVTGYISLVGFANVTGLRGIRALRPLRTITRIKEMKVRVHALCLSHSHTVRLCLLEQCLTLACDHLAQLTHLQQSLNATLLFVIPDVHARRTSLAQSSHACQQWWT